MVRGSMPRYRFLALAGLTAALAGGTAVASPVYPGCPEPPASGGRSFWVDPIHGSDAGDGSRIHPWRTLEEVVADGRFVTAPAIVRRDAVSHWMAKLGIAGLAQSRSRGVIQPGDTVWLMSGDQGAVKLQGYYGKGDTLLGYDNPQFITIAAAPGQTPVLRRLQVLGGRRWAFRGLTVESLNDTGQFAAGGTVGQDYALVMFTGPHSDIIFDGNTLRSAANVRAWSLDDWRRKRASGVVDRDGACVAITNNALTNVGNGFQTQSSNRVLIENNTIDHFSDDGIDYGSSNLRIAHNRITNSIEDGDGIHRDGMQGQPGRPFTQQAIAENIEISDNTVIRIADPGLERPGILQGIDAFDGVWKNVRVTNNVVIVDAWHGISFYGVHGALISGNIVLADSGRVLPCSRVSFEACVTKKVVTDLSTHPQIVVNWSKIRVPSSDVVIKGNITNGIGVDKRTLNVSVTDNLCIVTTTKCTIGIPVGNTMIWANNPGEYGQHNVIPMFDARGLFVSYDPRLARYELKLKRANPAVSR
jgi:hypothetical protein